MNNEAVGMWGEGERVFPLKKRRGSLERELGDQKKTKTNNNNNNNKNNNNKKKWVHHDKDQEEEEEEEEEGKDSNMNKKQKKMKRENGGGGVEVVMEGSRCSRINGRGWRCLQQTLVGYSLCEHHLGKGRLRSMNTIRNTTSMTILTYKPNNKIIKDLEIDSSSSLLSQSKLQEEETIVINDDEEEEKEMKEKTLLIQMKKKKKRKKIGMVKARSISSLLNQTRQS